MDKKNRAAVALVREEAAFGEMEMFTAVEKADPGFAREIRADYEESMRVQAEIDAEYPDGDEPKGEFQRRISSTNRWIQLLSEAFQGIELPGPTEAEAKGFRQAVRTRMEGKDIH